MDGCLPEGSQLTVTSVIERRQECRLKGRIVKPGRYVLGIKGENRRGKGVTKNNGEKAVVDRKMRRTERLGTGSIFPRKKKKISSDIDGI